MKKRTSQFAFFLFALSIIFLQSCVDESYDLSEDNLSTEVSFGGSNLAFPIGSTDSIFLGDLIPEDNDLIALNDDSIYSISMSSTIDPISLSIDPITLNIGDVSIDPLELEFGSTSVPDFNLAQISTSSNFSVPEADLTDLTLPTVQTNFPYSQNLPAPVTVAGVDIDAVLQFDGDPIATTFTYDLNANEEVDAINIVYLGSDENGDRFSMTIDVSAITSALDPAQSTLTIDDFHITFPDDFVIAADQSSPLISSSSISGSTYNISNYAIPNGADEVEISFYLKSLNLNQTGNINYSENVTYGLEMTIDGVSNGESISSLDVSVLADNQLTLNYADITTADLSIDSFEPGSFNMATSIDGLEDLKSIGLIEFETTSELNINISDPGLPLSFIDGDLTIQFPTIFEFDQTLSTLGAATLNASNQLIIPAEDLFGARITLVMKTLDLSDKPIVDASISLDEVVSYEATGLTMGSERMETTELNGLGQKSIDITIPESPMGIEAATVTTKSITAEVAQSSVFELNEKVPTEIQALQFVSLTENSMINISINFDGVPDGLGNLTFDEFAINLPSFIQFAESDGVVDGVLALDESFSANTGYSKMLTITGIDFTSAFGANGVETIDVNGKNMLIINSNNAITLEGGVKTQESTLSSDDLDGLSITPSVTIEPLTVGEVIGTFDPKIDPVDQSVELDLGDGLTFLEEANIKFNNPQIMLTINSNIGLPVDIDLELQGKDTDGNIVEGSTVKTTAIKIKAAEVVGESTPSKFLLSEQGTTLPGYEPIQIQGISNLLQTLPDMISFQMTAASDKTQQHKIDLNKELTISGEYEIAVPLEFDEFEINYDTIYDGMAEGMADLFESLGDIEVNVQAFIENSIPLAFNIDLTPIDINGDTLVGVTTSISDTIPAGDGVIAASEELIIQLSSENDAISNFDGFIVNLSVKANSTVGGAALRDDQFIRIRDIAILIPEGINIDINN